MCLYHLFNCCLFIFSVGDRSVSESFCWTLPWAAVCWFHGLLRYFKRSHSSYQCKYHNYFLVVSSVLDYSHVIGISQDKITCFTVQQNGFIITFITRLLFISLLLLFISHFYKILTFYSYVFNFHMFNNDKLLEILVYIGTTQQKISERLLRLLICNHFVSNLCMLGFGI